MFAHIAMDDMYVYTIYLCTVSYPSYICSLYIMHIFACAIYCHTCIYIIFTKKSLLSLSLPLPLLTVINFSEIRADIVTTLPHIFSWFYLFFFLTSFNGLTTTSIIMRNRESTIFWTVMQNHFERSLPITCVESICDKSCESFLCVKFYICIYVTRYH